jgi:CheY-like chemotaxis protein/cell division septum initiation protein DivIVA
MFNRAFIGYNPSGVRLLMEQMEKEYEELAREKEAVLARIEDLNQELAEEVAGLRSCVSEASRRREQMERYGEVFDRLLLACRDWCEEEIRKIKETIKKEELSLAKYDEDISLKEAAVDGLRRSLAEQLARLAEEAKKNVNTGKSQVRTSLSQLDEIAKLGALLPSPSPSNKKSELETGAPAGSEPARQSTRLNSRVLTIDDDPSICSIVRVVMEREGYEVDELHDGRAAVDFIEKNPPCAMVIVDLMLPFVDGLQVVRKIRATPDWREVPVIVLSSNSSEREIIDLFEAGASEYMTKPFSTLELAARARRLVGKR